MSKIQLDIKGMHCSSCAMDIDLDLEDLNGIKSAQTSYARQTTEVEFDEKVVGVNEIIATIGETGYQAETKN